MPRAASPRLAHHTLSARQELHSAGFCPCLTLSLNSATALHLLVAVFCLPRHPLGLKPSLLSICIFCKKDLLHSSVTSECESQFNWSLFRCLLGAFGVRERERIHIIQTNKKVHKTYVIIISAAQVLTLCVLRRFQLEQK